MLRVFEEAQPSVREEMSHCNSRVGRFQDTVEMSDYFRKLDEKPATVEPAEGAADQLYRLDQTFDMDKLENEKAEPGLGEVIDQLALIAPQFAVVNRIQDFDEANF